MQFWTEEECWRQIYGETFLLEHFAGTTLILLTAKIRHMERFHYRLWRTNKPLLKLFHGWDTPKEQGKRNFFLRKISRNIEIRKRKDKIFSAARRNQKCVLFHHRKSRPLYILFFPVLFAPRQTLRFIERVGTRARSYDKISRAVWRITP